MRCCKLVSHLCQRKPGKFLVWVSAQHIPRSFLVLARCMSLQCTPWHRISGGEKRFISLIVLEVQHPRLGTLASVASDKGGRWGHIVLGKQVRQTVASSAGSRESGWSQSLVFVKTERDTQEIIHVLNDLETFHYVPWPHGPSASHTGLLWVLTL